MSLTAKRRPPAHYKKRQAAHHRHSKHYLKTYWPYLPMLMLLAIVLVTHGIWSSSASGVLGAQANLAPTSLLAATNTDRQDNHQAALNLNSQLDRAAQAKANNMVSQNYWAHVSPTGQTAWQLIIASGYSFESAGENLAYGLNSSSAVLSAWMSSPEHRANILDSNYRDVGFGVAESANYIGQGPKIIVVAEYGQPGSGVLGARTYVNQPPIQNVSKWQLLIGNSTNWSEITLAAILGAAVTLLLVRHGLYLKKALVKSESLIEHRPLLDVSLVVLGVVAVLLMHSAGHIG